MVILTAYPNVEDVIHAIEEGACDYILKPFRIFELLEAVEEALKPKTQDKWL